MIFNTTELLKYEKSHFLRALALQYSAEYSFHGYLSLNSNLKVPG